MTKTQKITIRALVSVSVFLLANSANSQITDTVDSNKKLNKPDFIWEIGLGETFFSNSNVLSNRLNVEGQPISFHYYISTRIALDNKRDVSKFYLKAGIGTNLKTFGLDKTIEVVDENLVFSDFQALSSTDYSLFQQWFLDVPLSICYESRFNKKGRNISVEVGGVLGAQVYNRWKTSETIDNIKTIRSEEGLPQTNPLHYGSSFKIATNKNRGAFSTGFFISGTYYFSDVFKVSSNTPTNSYIFRVGMTITAHNLLKNSL